MDEFIIDWVLEIERVNNELLVELQDFLSSNPSVFPGSLISSISEKNGCIAAQSDNVLKALKSSMSKVGAADEK